MEIFMFFYLGIGHFQKWFPIDQSYSKYCLFGCEQAWYSLFNQSINLIVNMILLGGKPKDGLINQSIAKYYLAGWETVWSSLLLSIWRWRRRRSHVGTTQGIHPFISLLIYSFFIDLFIHSFIYSSFHPSLY